MAYNIEAPSPLIDNIDLFVFIIVSTVGWTWWDWSL